MSKYENVDFTKQIMQDLVSRGYEGEELEAEFKRIKAAIPDALESLKREALNQPTYKGGGLDLFLDSVEEDSE